MSVVLLKIARGIHNVVPSPEGPGAGSTSTMPRDDAILIPLCSISKATVIPGY